MISGKDAASGRSDLCPAGQELPDSYRPNDLMELDMFVTAKLKLLSGMVIGASAVMVMTKCASSAASTVVPHLSCHRRTKPGRTISDARLLQRLEGRSSQPLAAQGETNGESDVSCQ